MSTLRLPRYRSGINRESFQLPSKEPVLANNDKCRNIPPEPKIAFDLEPEIPLQPETRPKSNEQLVAEVKGIYSGLDMLEAKCEEVGIQQTISAQAHPSTQLKFSKLSNIQWQAIIVLHRTLLHEHHDFFLVSQFPSASTALRQLASNYATPAQMWRHGIHGFLELLRHRFPDSMEHILAFIYLAYFMIAILYETLPGFSDAWVTCLGDLGRYRRAIEEEDIKEGEVWASVAKIWYVKASDKSPGTGRLHHHLAILARPHALEEPNFYVKSLFGSAPFGHARASIMTLYSPILKKATLKKQETIYQRPCEPILVKAFGLCVSTDHDKSDSLMADVMRLSDNWVNWVAAKRLTQEYQIAVLDDTFTLGFGYEEDLCMKAMSGFIATSREAARGTEGSSLTQWKEIFGYRERLKDVLSGVDNLNILSLFYVTLVFSGLAIRHSAALASLEANFPWQFLTALLNASNAGCESKTIDRQPFPRPMPRALPEDFCMRGLLYMESYFPNNWFDDQMTDEDVKDMEVSSNVIRSKGRILWLEGCNMKFWRSDREKLNVCLSKIAVDTRSVSNKEQHDIQSEASNTFGILKSITKGVSQTRSILRTSENGPGIRYSSLWTDSSSSYHSSIGTLRLVDTLQTHEYHGSQPNSSGQQVTSCFIGKLALTKIGSFFNLLSCTRTVKRFLRRQFTRLLSSKNHTFIIGIAAMFGNMPNVMAMPLNPPPSSMLSPEEDDSGFSQYWKDIWIVFKDHYSGPLTMNILWAAFLACLFVLIVCHDKGRWKETNLIAIAIWCTSIPSFFLGMGDWLSDWQLALLWIFNAKLNLKLLERNLLSLPRSRSLTSICIITIGCVSAGILAQRIPQEDGRYANYWILATMLAPFMTCFIIHIWSVFVKDTGIARGLEDGTYTEVTARLRRQVNRLLQQILFTIVALVVIRLMH